MADKRGTESLKKSMGFLGRIMERLIGQAKKAKGTLEARSGLQVILSLESRLAIPKLKQLIDLISDRFISTTLPNFNDKNVLEIGEGPLRLQRILAKQKPSFLCSVLVEGALVSAAPTTQSPSILKCSLKSLPFEDHFFDYILARLTTPHQGDVVSVFKEMGRILIAGGQAFVLDFHPFGLYAKSGSPRLRSVQATIRGLEDYYKMCRVAGLSIVNLQEGFIDDTLRNQFTSSEEMNAFREIKGTPLVLFLQVVKPRLKT